MHRLTLVLSLLSLVTCHCLIISLLYKYPYILFVQRVSQPDSLSFICLLQGFHDNKINVHRAKTVCDHCIITAPSGQLSVSLTEYSPRQRQTLSVCRHEDGGCCRRAGVIGPARGKERTAHVDDACNAI
jgi:hypothetical protein